MNRPKPNGDADLAAELMRDLGDGPDEDYLDLDEDGNEIHVPLYMREERARLVANGILGGAKSK